MKKNHQTKTQIVKVVEINHTNEQLSSQFKDEYDTFFKDIKPITKQQIIKNLTNQGIKYKQDGNVQIRQSINESDLIIKSAKYTVNSEVVSMNVQMGNFETMIVVLNVNEESPTHRTQRLNFGSYGEVYAYSFQDKQESVTKCIYLENDKVNVFQRGLLQIIREYFFLKICSALQIGPCLCRIFGFDIICFKDCAQFTVEQCQQIQKEQMRSNHCSQILKQSLLTLHSLNIVHRDIKPENIMKSVKFEKYVFIDLGSALCIKEHVGFKTKSGFCGTYNYVSQQMTKTFQNEPLFVDLYYNDVHCLKETRKIGLKQRKNKQLFELTPLAETFQLCLIKYLLFTDQIEKLEFILNSAIKSMFFKQILEFLAQIQPTQRLRHFYLRQFEYQISNEGNSFLVQIRNIYSKECIKTFQLPRNEKKNLIFEPKYSDLENCRISQSRIQKKSNLLGKLLKDFQLNYQNCRLQTCLKISEVYLDCLLHQQTFHMANKVQLSHQFQQKFRVLQFWIIYDQFQILSIKQINSNVKNIQKIIKNCKNKQLKRSILIKLANVFRLILRNSETSLILLQQLIQISQQTLEIINFCSIIFFNSRKKYSKEKFTILEKVLNILGPLKCQKQQQTNAKQFAIQGFQLVTKIEFSLNFKEIDQLIPIIDCIFQWKKQKSWAFSLAKNIQTWIEQSHLFMHKLAKYNLAYSLQQSLLQDGKAQSKLTIRILTKFYLNLGNLAKAKIYLNQEKRLINLDNYFDYIRSDLIGELLLKQKKFKESIKYFNQHLSKHQFKSSKLNKLSFLSYVLSRFGIDIIQYAQSFIKTIFQLLDSIDQTEIKTNLKQYYFYYYHSLSAFLHLKYSQKNLHQQCEQRINKFSTIFGECNASFQLKAILASMKSQKKKAIEYYRKGENESIGIDFQQNSRIGSQMSLINILMNSSGIEKQEGQKRIIQNYFLYKYDVIHWFLLNDSLITLTLICLSQQNKLDECCEFIKILSRYSSSFPNSVLYRKYFGTVNEFIRSCSCQKISKLFFNLSHSDYYKRHSVYKQLALFAALVLFKNKQVQNEKIILFLKQITLTFTLISKQTKNAILKYYYLSAARVQQRLRKIKNYYYRKHLFSNSQEKLILRIIKHKKIKFLEKWEKAVEQKMIIRKYRNKFVKNLRQCAQK